MMRIDFTVLKTLSPFANDSHNIQLAFQGDLIPVFITEYIHFLEYYLLFSMVIHK